MMIAVADGSMAEPKLARWFRKTSRATSD